MAIAAGLSWSAAALSGAAAAAAGDEEVGLLRDDGIGPL
eukprot:CAMPEP_0178431100 /NCGR_PEP_ID=MMETSP0689_2-20121128/31664_1 /TAXON_ID=160604 /ORGANISM="Amphidinium massartii, Strain CS-259" /LENGTH=38 /DNA_ID= /DNA_START= /DNA_END= /DNA_ORIENTATION=